MPTMEQAQTIICTFNEYEKMNYMQHLRHILSLDQVDLETPKCQNPYLLEYSKIIHKTGEKEVHQIRNTEEIIQHWEETGKSDT